MKPEIWGKSGWTFLHNIAIQPTNEHHIIFFNSLQYVLPCGKCRSHYADYLHSNPIDLSTILAQWVQKLHDNVNHRLNKQKHTSSTSSAEEDYWKFLFAIVHEYPAQPTWRVFNQYKDFLNVCHMFYLRNGIRDHCQSTVI